MSSAQDSPNRTLKARKNPTANPPSITNPGHSGPTTFFLKSEKEISERGRRMSRSGRAEEGPSTQKPPSISDESSYGVQSLEDAIASSYTASDLSRTDSNATDENAAPGAIDGSPAIVAGRKRKAGNPVHPRIAATGQRIISSEQHPSNYTSATGSPVSIRSSESPFRTRLRRGSGTSSINLSAPLTPLKGSPHAASALPSTPRSGSPKSFRLSDEEASVASDSGSQAIASSSGEDDEEDNGIAVPAAMPQLVMPSLAMPARRPFTERGRRMGRLRVMVVGPKGVGKTSLIQSICRVCEDVVHVDPIVEGGAGTEGMVEVGASSKPYPPWRGDFEGSQRLRRASLGEGVLERNLGFVDTAGLEGEREWEGGCERVVGYVRESMERMLDLRRLNDGEVVGMLAGEGGSQIDVVIYVFDAATPLFAPAGLQPDKWQLLKDLDSWTTVIPVLGRSDAVDADTLETLRKQLGMALEPIGLPTQASKHFPSEGSVSARLEPLAISSALQDDSETMDASLLMSSTYLQPLVPSELPTLVHQLLDPDNIARLRHLSANKFLHYREKLASRVDLPKQTLLTSPGTGSPVSPSEDAAKALVPHASSSPYFRSLSPSPSPSDTSSGPIIKHTLENITEPFRQVRLAKWAQDLRRSLDNERNRYKRMYAQTPPAADAEKQLSDPDRSLTTRASPHSRPPKGRLGGDLGVIDPRDPLGLLSLRHLMRQRSFFLLRVAGGCGLVGAVAWWVVRNWVEVQEWLGFGAGGGSGHVVGTAPVSVAVADEGRGWFEEGVRNARLWEGWLREGLGGVGR